MTSKIQPILTAFNSICLVGVLLYLILSGKQKEEVSFDNKYLLEKIDSNMVVIKAAVLSSDSVLKSDLKLSLQESEGISQSISFVNKIPHLSDDTLSFYYQNSFLNLRSMYREGKLRPSE